VGQAWCCSNPSSDAQLPICVLQITEKSFYDIVRPGDRQEVKQYIEVAKTWNGVGRLSPSGYSYLTFGLINVSLDPSSEPPCRSQELKEFIIDRGTKLSRWKASSQRTRMVCSASSRGRRDQLAAFRGILTVTGSTHLQPCNEGKSQMWEDIPQATHHLTTRDGNVVTNVHP
jgi:hypothetical protein